MTGGSSNAEGRVEVYYNSRWGTICDDYFNMYAANVVCRQVGYKYALTYGKAYTMGFGQGTGAIHIDDLQCTGKETEVQNCRFNGWGEHNCQHSEDVGVVYSLPSASCGQSTRVEKEKSKG